MSVPGRLPIFEHIDVLLFVEGKLFIDGVEEGYDVSVVIPHEKVMHRLHPVVTPHCLTARVSILLYSSPTGQNRHIL